MKSPIYIDKKPKPSLRWGLSLLAVAAVAAAVAYHDGGGRQERQTVTLARVPPAGAADLPTARSGAQAAAAAPAPLPSETRAQQFDRLARGTPAEALEAVKLLRACDVLDLAKRERENHIAEGETVPAQLDAWAGAADSCDGFAGAQKAQAIPLALKAAQAGVPGAFGELRRLEAQSFKQDGMEDPRIAAALPAIWDAYVKVADPGALLEKSMQEDGSMCLDPPACSNVNPYQSLVHWTAYVDTGASKTVAANGDTVTPRYAATLGPDQAQAQAAIAEGHTLYANRSVK
jgi:hypothetical protein